MPRYDYSCSICGFQIEVDCKIAERPISFPCELDCAGEMRQVIVAPAIRCDDIVNIPWLQDVARTRKEARHGGKPIETRKEYHEYLKSHNLRDPHKGENLTEF